MLGHIQVRKQLNRMNERLTKAEAEWNAHMALTNARLNASSPKPFIDDSTTIEQALMYLDSEIRLLNYRFTALTPWGFNEDPDGNPVDFTIQGLLRDHEVDGIGTETQAWHLRRTMVEVEDFLLYGSDMLDIFEGKVSARMTQMRGSLNISIEVQDYPIFGALSSMYERAEADWLLDGDWERFAKRVARVEGKWKAAHGPRETGFRRFENLKDWETLQTLEWGGRMAKVGMAVPRQTQITDFFEAEEGN